MYYRFVTRRKLALFLWLLILLGFTTSVSITSMSLVKEQCGDLLQEGQTCLFGGFADPITLEPSDTQVFLCDLTDISFDNKGKTLLVRRRVFNGSILTVI